MSKTGAAKSFAKQLGWQEAITKLFILRPLPNICDNELANNDDITMSDDIISKGDNLIDFTENHFKGSNSEGIDQSKNDSMNNLIDLTNGSEQNGGDLNQNAKSEDSLDSKTDSVELLKQPLLREVSELSLLSDIKSALKPEVKFTLELNKNENYKELSPSPQTPLYLKRGMNDIYSEDEISQPISRSSSASAEDLSAIGQRRAEQIHNMQDSETSSSLKQSDSDFNLESEVVCRRESLSSSQINYSDSMRDSLGLRGSFLMESVGDSEELCQNLLMVLLTIMWKGVEGSDKTAWQERGQVFSWFDHISETNELVRPVKELKRCLLEMLVHSCMSEIKDAGK